MGAYTSGTRAVHEAYTRFGVKQPSSSRECGASEPEVVLIWNAYFLYVI